MSTPVRKEMLIDPETLEEAKQLAVANFRKPSGVGNFNALMRHLIHVAYREPEKFGLAEPGQRFEDLPTVNEAMSHD